jgi:hypothetical protein
MVVVPGEAVVAPHNARGVVASIWSLNPSAHHASALLERYWMACVKGKSMVGVHQGGGAV